MASIKYKCWPAKERNLDIENDEGTHRDKVFVRDIEFPAGVLSWFREDDKLKLRQDKFLKNL